MVTLFHEFGHLMHHVLAGRHAWVRFAGVATEWDFVEAPEPDARGVGLGRRACCGGFATDEPATPIPADLVGPDARRRRVRQGLPGGAPRCSTPRCPTGCTTSGPRTSPPGSRELWAAYNLVAPLPETHFFTGFGHLDGYTSAYYTYMWSLVIAKDLFSRLRRRRPVRPRGRAPLPRPDPGARRQRRTPPTWSRTSSAAPTTSAPSGPGWTRSPELSELSRTSTSPPTPTTAPAYCASTSLARRAVGRPETRVLVVAGTRVRPVDGGSTGDPARTRPTAPGCCSASGTARTWFAVLVDPAQAPGERGDWVGLRAPAAAPRRRRRSAGAAAVPRDRAGRVALRDPLLPALRRRAGGAQAGHELHCPSCGKTSSRAPTRP